jgi:hypothetical protein
MDILDVKQEDRKKIAIVAVGYNRLASLKRLLDSLQLAKYKHDNIPLVISIDASGDEALYDFVRNFEWKHGTKYVNIQKERLGLRRHILQCGGLTQYFRAVIILEDDIFVSEYFYSYVEQTVGFYYNEDRIGGISLYQNEMIGDFPVIYMKDGSDTYLKQAPESWGECWTDRQWNQFKTWYDGFTEDRFKDLDIPEHIKKWQKAWSKYYYAYLKETSRYFVFPQISHTTCFGDAGEHSAVSSSIGQTNLLMGKPNYDFKPFDEMARYDSYDNNEALYEWLGIPQDELCIDFRCNKINIRKCRYLLTPAIKQYKVLRSFAMTMRPVELNIKYNIRGSEIFLYDTVDGNSNAITKKLPLSLAFYHIRSFDLGLLKNLVILNYKDIIKRSIKRRLGL